MTRLFSVLLLLVGTHFALAADDYQLGPDSQPQDGVPKGTVTKHTWTSKIFDGTVRDYWVYVPAQYDASKTPACVMVFQDGEGYMNPKGGIRIPVVFDNLIHKQQMPVTIGIFINPGTFPPAQPGGKGASNRSFEYDTLSDQCARFLLDEMLPEVAKTYKLTDDPDGRAICGLSSGGICAFTVAWERPDSFRKVVSMIGSFTSIAYRPALPGQPLRPGGDLYPTFIRKTPIKPLKVFLQDGSGDLNNDHGSWFLANQQMLSALEYANAKADRSAAPGPRYQLNHAWGDGGHSNKHGGAIFPDILRWLWKAYEGQ